MKKKISYEVKIKPTKTNWRKQRVLDEEQYDPTMVAFRKAVMDSYRRRFIDKVS